MMARPAVNPPREEPAHHWRYDCTTRLFDLVPGRRPAGYVVASEDSRTIDAPAPCFLRRGLLLGGRRQIVHRDAEGIGDVAQRLHGSGGGAVFYRGQLGVGHLRLASQCGDGQPALLAPDPDRVAAVTETVHGYDRNELLAAGVALAQRLAVGDVFGGVAQLVVVPDRHDRAGPCGPWVSATVILSLGRRRNGSFERWMSERRRGRSCAGGPPESAEAPARRRRFSIREILPPHDVGSWPQDFTVRREQIHDDVGRLTEWAEDLSGDGR